MRYYELPVFRKWAKGEKITDLALFNAADEIETGLVEAELGGGLFKKRIARKGQGKSGGYRTIIAFRKDERTFYIYGWSKSELENIGKEELKVLKKKTKQLFDFSQNQLDQMVQDEALFEIER